MKFKNNIYKITTVISLSALAVLISFVVALWPQNEQVKHSISYAEAAELTQYATPQDIGNIAKSIGSGSSIEVNKQLDYAIPKGIKIFHAETTSYPSNNTIYPIPIFQDLNGDGLVDIIYAYIPYEYVLINNGHGFNVAYICLSYTLDNVTTYYGHCAA